MGDRAELQMNFPENGALYLYTHWHGSELPIRLRHALEHGISRWGNESYLARILISRIVTDHEDTTGHGIAPYPMESEYPKLIADLDRQTVTINGHAYTFRQYIAANERDILRHWYDADDEYVDED